MDEVGGGSSTAESLPAHAGLRYALLRLVLLVAVGAVLYLIGMRSWPWLFATVLVSAVLSFFVLLRQREAAARSLEATMSARAARKRGGEETTDAPPRASEAATGDPGDPDGSSAGPRPA